MNIEELLKVDSKISNNILQFFSTKEATQLRLVSKNIEETIQTIEFNDVETKIKGKFRDWFECFPKAIGGYFDNTAYISMYDIQDITKIKNIDGSTFLMQKLLVLISIYKFAKIDISI
jgi:hypothetical protein